MMMNYNHQLLGNNNITTTNNYPTNMNYNNHFILPSLLDTSNLSSAFNLNTQQDVFSLH